eukprot:252190-Chlamydomonas_euryale.AAC.1
MDWIGFQSKNLQRAVHISPPPPASKADQGNEDRGSSALDPGGLDKKPFAGLGQTRKQRRENSEGKIAQGKQRRENSIGKTA